MFSVNLPTAQGEGGSSSSAEAKSQEKTGKKKLNLEFDLTLRVLSSWQPHNNDLVTFGNLLVW